MTVIPEPPSPARDAAPRKRGRAAGIPNCPKPSHASVQWQWHVYVALGVAGGTITELVDWLLGLGMTEQELRWRDGLP